MAQAFRVSHEGTLCQCSSTSRSPSAIVSECVPRPVSVTIRPVDSTCSSRNGPDGKLQVAQNWPGRAVRCIRTILPGFGLGKTGEKWLLKLSVANLPDTALT